MDPRPITRILADNLRHAMETHDLIRGNQSELSRRCGIRQTTIGYMLNPDTRAPTKKGASSPTLDIIDKVARALGMQAWQLIYPDPYRRPVTEEERRLWDQIQQDFERLHQLQEPRKPYGDQS